MPGSRKSRGQITFAFGKNHLKLGLSGTIFMHFHRLHFSSLKFVKKFNWRFSHKTMIIQNNHYICPIPSKLKTMMNRLFFFIAIVAMVSISSSCKLLSGKNKSGGSLPNDGQLHGVAQYTPFPDASQASGNGVYSTRHFSYGCQ